ncbi:hypothetical protein Sa4125_34240 [Aureimonas sp. SA4125]|uniref:hypothetical protein n=1 Tax=Aureimonas sp. SA4125 TaxID=2826993 RepID=UPI001CC42C0B|nr:hypothetical protein [Aureimonas sp. SA4125]BDA85882.1 hypothetical protein Sa4125_34240 [Aureimonas sp. SA4125]
MEHIAAFMLLVGCNADASVCKEIPVPVAAYEDQAECGRDLALQMRLSGTDDIKVYGVCKDVNEDVFEQSANIDWSISKAGRLIVTFDAEPQIVASR